MRIILVRHGETDYNAARICQGWLPSRLSDLGREQARKTGQSLSSENVEVVYCSDLVRTKETLHEIQLFISCPVVYMEWLRERTFGEFEGKPKGTFDVYIAQNNLDRLTYCPPRGESLLQFRTRVLEGFEQLLRSESSKTILLVTHGGNILQILRSVLKFDDAEREKYKASNCAVSVIDVNGNSRTVSCLNSVDHLA